MKAEPLHRLAARMAYIEPPNATIINPDPIALVRGALIEPDRIGIIP